MLWPVLVHRHGSVSSAVACLLGLKQALVLGFRFMAELGKVVPILPIVTKADSMTIREAATYRREVYRKLQNPQLPEPQGHRRHSPPYPSLLTGEVCVCLSVCLCT